MPIRLMVEDDIHRGQGGCVKGGGFEGLKGLELCVRHAEVSGGWEGEGECASAPEVAGVEARRVLKEARPLGEMI